ncbi:PDC sensor domain-containing protein [Mangrovibacter phragmitis]|uniref:PDC sensor domain-containing protein n=1 Tax=Mangrovibacter phragmitis TaxID=1691903 RepID=UPI003512ABD1
MKKSIACGLFCASLLLPLTGLANEYSGAITKLADTDIKSWISSPEIINAVKAQNQKNSGLTAADINKMDKEWTAEVTQKEKPLIDKVLNNPLSEFLRKKLDDSNGLYTEIFVMDDKGLNVGQSNITSDYWQGDEAKWQQTYAKGPGSINIGEVDEDESTQTYQSQLSLPVVDPDTGKAIGAITIGINVNAL